MPSTERRSQDPVSTKKVLFCIAIIKNEQYFPHIRNPREEMKNTSILGFHETSHTEPNLESITPAQTCLDKASEAPKNPRHKGLEVRDTDYTLTI